MLLSATPEQTGEREHFSRLQLLDPEHYHSFEVYQAQQAEFKNAAELAEKLLPYTEASNALENLDWSSVLSEYIHDVQAKDWFVDLSHADKDKQSQAARDAVNWLIDRHGTGREMFRNTRAAIGIR